MNANPILKKLGYSEADRLVIIHADDIGMCQASLQAFKDLWAVGSITSGAVMVPCPWFPAAAQMCRENPEMDMGVHATLNAEWENYRWGPVSTRDQASGLMDADGYFHQWHEAVYQNARPEAVAVEVNAQVEKALAAGIDVTHVDSHMGTILNSLFIQSYIQAAASRLLPNMLPRTNAKGIEMMGASSEELMIYEPIMAQLESMGIPTLEGIVAMPLDHAEDHTGFAKKLLSELPAGITHFILHPSIDTPELRAICPDWPARVANYNAFMSDELKKFIESENIKLIGYRQIRNAMKN
ncbi:polysaccharide deacetylase family protein [Candidatus Villigracilis saccharophilus]|uniref:polysaccharide deacetylase family protein n=1 Tax=Candidatus Villigracilis saccharophilus TaxID=3140684 RepID=UPI003136E1B1|nr:polysaccharide deacetylase family protein [Anaerolineales bacterium]